MAQNMTRSVYGDDNPPIQDDLIKRVDVTIIKDNPYQSHFRAVPRTSEEKEREREFLTRLAESIRRGELYHPLMLTKTPDGDIRLVSGTARRDAHLLAMKLFPKEADRFRYARSIVVDNLAEDEWMLRSYEENSIRRQLDPIKEAEYFQFLKDKRGMTQREIAQLLGISEALVSSRLALLSEPSIKTAVETGELSVKTAREKVWKMHREKKIPKSDAPSGSHPPLRQYAASTRGATTNSERLPSYVEDLKRLAAELDSLAQKIYAVGRHLTTSDPVLTQIPSILKRLDRSLGLVRKTIRL